MPAYSKPLKTGMMLQGAFIYRPKFYQTKTNRKYQTKYKSAKMFSILILNAE